MGEQSPLVFFLFQFYLTLLGGGKSNPDVEYWILRIRPIRSVGRVRPQAETGKYIDINMRRSIFSFGR